jgi:SNF2 family DNA or RNA helicase
MTNNKIFSKYQNLPYLEKRIVQLRSLTAINMPRTYFMHILNKTDLKEHLGKSFSNTYMAAIFQELINIKILEHNNALNRNILHQITLDALYGENGEKNRKAIHSVVDFQHFAKYINFLRLGIYLNNIEIFNRALPVNRNIAHDLTIILDLTEYFKNDKFPQKLLKKCHPSIRCWLVATKIHNILRNNYKNIIDTEDVESFSGIETIKQCNNSNYIITLFLDYFFLKGDLTSIIGLIKITKSNLLLNNSLLAVYCFLNNEQEQALTHFDHAITLLKSSYKKRNIALSGIFGIFHILALLSSNKDKNSKQIENLLAYYSKMKVIYNKELTNIKYHEPQTKVFEYFYGQHSYSYYLLATLQKFFSSGNELIKIDRLPSYFEGTNGGNLLDGFLFILITHWTRSKNNKFTDVSKTFNKNHQVTIKWASNLVATLDPDKTSHEKITNPYNIDFTNIIKTKESWARKLDNLSNYFGPEELTLSDKRIIWILSIGEYNNTIKPVEQARNKNGKWNKGRDASVLRLYESMHQLDYLTSHDKAILSCRQDNYGYYGNSIDYNQGVQALVGHPLIFEDKTSKKIELGIIKPELIVNEKPKEFSIQLSHVVTQDINTVELYKESSNKYNVVNVSNKLKELSEILGKKGLLIPNSERAQVMSLMKNAASKLHVRSELSNYDDLETTPGDAIIIIQLEFVDALENNLLTAQIFVRPFGGIGAYYKPGQGSTNIIAQINGEYKSVHRDFALEADNAQRILSNCPSLERQNNIDYEWNIPDMNIILEILYEIKAAQGNCKLIIEWPKGESLNLKEEVSFKNLEIELNKESQWLEFDGRLKIDENEVMEMKTLLENVEQMNGRFIRLKGNQFLTLTHSFAQKLKELQKAALNKGKNLGIHALGVNLLRDFTENAASIKANTEWKNYIKKLDSIKSTNPKVPKTLQAELRPYQKDGFQWLSRLSNIGFGGLLADDMGLGKTVQSIAILLEQAPKGQCMVVAPASVCNVWQEEIAKFAPSLNCISLNDKDRQTQIINLSKMDILICSYGLIYQIEEMLHKQKFQMLIVDEAQAIKNFNTKRFKIITQIKAENRIALSGTPIENRIDELWNLFEFLNPGFLGGRKSFQDKYVRPIEKDGDIIARNTLKRLIQPFMLRRTKSNVLSDLPPKIEQTLFIEPSLEEKNFYEALRRKAVERIADISDDDQGKKRFCVLAEITKLRRACCDPRLLDSNTEIPNSKLETLDNLLQELKENNHRALIFSQYVDYLSIVKDRIIKQDITLQYLDGKTSQKKRKIAVEEFQAGKGDVFLISLKAGGVGLNLTAADYVIHLDPWWNPAVEDQASDRAHRIGQTRPVTIYRLVMKYSIEERILALHGKKRALSIGLLDDAESAASLNEKDLLSLINESFGQVL